MSQWSEKRSSARMVDRSIRDPLAVPQGQWCIRWRHRHYAETSSLQNLQAVPLAQSEYHQRRIDRAQLRYLAAIRSLAQVRRLLGPVVQITVADTKPRLGIRVPLLFFSTR